MKRALFQSRLSVAALMAALIWSLAPGAALSTHTPPGLRDRRAAKITLAHTAEVKVSAGPTGVLIEWRTSFELDNLGFNVYRDEGGRRTQVNPSIIAGSALIAGQGTPLYAGYSYRWFDAAGSLSSRYYLEDLDLKGVNTLTGPYTPVWDESVSKGQQARLMSEVAAQAAMTAQTGGPAGTFDEPSSTLASLPAQWAIVAQPGLKIGVKQDGWYRVTQPEMVAAGFDVSGDAGNLRLFVDGNEVPIEVSKTSGPLGANDFIEFYGTGLDTLTTDTHVSYLINGTQAGLRVQVFGEIQVDAGPTSSPRPAPVASPSDIGRFSSGSWFNDVSSGIVAVREARKQKPDLAIQSPAENVPLVEGSGAPASTRTANDANPDANPVKVVTSEAATNNPSKPASTPGVMTARSVPPGAPQLRGKSKYRRRRARQRRSHTAALKRRQNHAVATASSTAGFLYEIQQKERFVYFSSLLNGAAENYFGGSLLTPPYTQQNAPTTRTLNVKNLQTDSQGTALLRIGLQGTSLQAHLVNVLVNDVMVGSLSYSFEEYGEETFNVAVSLLHQGDNVIKFVTSNTNDRSLYSYARLTYPRTYRADNDTLSFLLRSTQSATIDGFTTPNIRVLDISNPASVQEVRPIVQRSGPGYAVTVPSTAVHAKVSRRFLALPSGSFLQPASLLFNQPSTLNQPGSANPLNAADLLIIAHKSFLSLPSLALLVAQRQGQGYTVKVVDVEDVFDEFSYGTHTPQAITDFLVRARANWTQAPRYLLLLGDASYDPRNYEGGGDFDLVPTKLIDTTFMETGSDDTLTDFDGDGIPEIPVGRLPVRTVAEANLVISKIVNFSPSNVPQNALMVADTQGSYFFNFEDANDQLSNNFLAPAGIPVQKVYRRLEPSDAAARADIISKINSGTALVNYSGHGNVDGWTGAPIFSASDAMALTNGNKLPLVIVMDCLNGYFIAPPIDCLSEALMKAPNGGAVASFSSSGLTVPTGQHEMGQRLFQLLYSGPPIALGDATRQAKAATTDIDVRRTWILFGDPTMKIR